MGRLFRRSFLLNFSKANEDLSLEIPVRHVALFWPTLFTIAFAFAALSAWLFTARLPVTVEARGIVMPPGGVREVVSLGQGLVTGHPQAIEGRIRSGDLLLELSDPTTESSYKEARKTYLLEVAHLDAQENAAQQRYESQEKELEIQLDSVRANIARLSTIAVALESAVSEYDTTMQSMLSLQQRTNDEVNQLAEKMQSGAEKLKRKGIVSDLDYFQYLRGRVMAQQSLSTSVTEISRAKVEWQRMRRELSEIKENIAADTVQEQNILGEIEGIRNRWSSERKELAVRAASSRGQLLDSERRLWLGTHIFSPYDGKLIATKKTLGQTVGQGEVVGLMKMTPQHRKLLLVISPRAQTGLIALSLEDREVTVPFRKSDPGFETRLRDALKILAPNIPIFLRIVENRIVIETSSTEFENLESLDLTNTDLTDSEGAPVFAMKLTIGDEWRNFAVEMIALLSPRDAKRVQYGDAALIKPDYERSLIGTQIAARVWQVSDYVSTSVEAQSLVGSTEIAQALTGDQGGVAVILHFERDPAGKLQLDGDTLSRPLTPGTMAGARIQVGAASPIEVLLPFYADLFGG